MKYTLLKTAYSQWANPMVYWLPLPGSCHQHPTHSVYQL